MPNKFLVEGYDMGNRISGGKVRPKDRVLPNGRVKLAYNPVLYKYPVKGELRVKVLRALREFLSKEAETSGILDFGQPNGGIAAGVESGFIFIDNQNDGRKWTFSHWAVDTMLEQLKTEGFLRTVRSGSQYTTWVVPGCDESVIGWRLAAIDAEKHSKSAKTKKLKVDVPATETVEVEATPEDTDPEAILDEIIAGLSQLQSRIGDLQRLLVKQNS